ncbi:LPS assembly lipoprotein LptE [Erwiniaceae bacterium L1_54_3]|uniref:LPS assembly lipoprotein LptE n=1 Tax=Candidatus Pantoea formicae TaxID=2608355 RepID=UPI001F04761D|nr:LPS assembly lipoprotein LptE [Pantoea formicae]MDF7650954.1 LPS assembly lipoprotein LptE [Erwiniaceae bacterium L1_54_3]
MKLCLAYQCLKSAMENPASLRVALAVFTENLRMLSRHSAVLFVRLVMPGAVLLLCGCGFHRHGHIRGGKTISVSLTTTDPYGPYARAVRRELRLDGIEVMRNGSDATPETVRVDLISSRVGSDTASVFINGSTAEYEMVMDARVSITAPGCSTVSVSIRPHKSYINYTSGALAVDAAKEVYTEEMYQQAAMMISRRVLAIWDKHNTCRQPS